MDAIVAVAAPAASPAPPACSGARNRDIAVVEPADVHYYQPGWTMVGAGLFTPESTQRAEKDVMPAGVTWIKGAVATFQPEDKTVMLEDGTVVRYTKLAVAPGFKLDWDGVEGLVATFGEKGVTSNYRYDLAPYTWRLAEGHQDGKALFTQPPMSIECDWQAMLKGREPSAKPQYATAA